MKLLVLFKRWIRSVLEKVPFGRRFLEAYGLYSRNKLARDHGGAQGFFEYVYKTNFWADPESVSGPDSTVAYTEQMRTSLQALLKRLGVRRILDASCGDFNWFKMVELPAGVTYVGGDIVEPLIARNIAQYGNENRSFQVIDICRDALPSSDIWICRNTLFHLSYADICLALRNGVDSGIGHFLITTHPRKDNADIVSGSYRPLDLEAAPFLLPEPLARIDDWAEGEEFRQLCLWSRDQISARINPTSDAGIDPQAQPGT